MIKTLDTSILSQKNTEVPVNNFYFLELFEQRLSEYTGAPYVVLVDSCTNAIFLALTAQGYDRQTFDVPKQTYVGVYNSILHSGNYPRPVDSKWTGGYCIGDTNVWDCAVGFKENIYMEEQLMCLSFQQKKAIKIGKGGAILLDNENLYNKLKRLSYDGRDYKINYRDDKIQLGGYHMNMIPEDAARGILLLNQYQFNENDIRTYADYKEINI